MDGLFDEAGPQESAVNDAVDDIGAGLGFGADDQEDGGDDIDLTVDPLTPEATDPAAAPAKPATDPAAPAATDPAAPAATDPASTAPVTWRKEAADAYAALPEVVKAEIVKREEDMFRGIEGYKQDAFFGKSVNKIMEPYLPLMQQYGIDPALQVSNLMRAHHSMVTGTPEQKTAFFKQLASDYKVDLGELDAPGSYVDPQVAGLQQKMDQILSNNARVEQQQQAQARQTIEAEINAFAADTAANPHFDAVANDIALLIKSGVPTLKEAYEKAVWSNPVTRAKEQSRLQTEAVAKAEGEKAVRLEAARKATAANVKSKARHGSTATPSGTFEDTLKEVYKDIAGRE